MCRTSCVRSSPSLARARVQVQRTGDVAPVQRHHALVVVHRIQGAFREARRGRVVQPDAVGIGDRLAGHRADRSEEHTSELQSLMRISYAVFCLKKKKTQKTKVNT